MNNFKNFVIIVLSFLLLVQSLFLLRLVSQQRNVSKSQRPKVSSKDQILPSSPSQSPPKSGDLYQRSSTVTRFAYEARRANSDEGETIAHPSSSKGEAIIHPPLSNGEVIKHPPLQKGERGGFPSTIISPTAGSRIVGKKAVTGKIALVLDDWGYNLTNKDFISSNDVHLTVAVLPFRAHSVEIARLAHQNNKEVIIHMPMEPQHKESYGLEENTLLASMDEKTIARIMDAAFQVVPYARGVNNHMGSRATEDAQFIQFVLRYLKKKNLFFLDSFVTPRSVCRGVAAKLGLRFAQRDIFIDNDSDAEYIRAQVSKLAALAKRKGAAVGIGHDRASTIAVLKEVIPKLEEEGYEFVALSEVVVTVE